MARKKTKKVELDLVSEALRDWSELGVEINLTHSHDPDGEGEDPLAVFTVEGSKDGAMVFLPACAHCGLREAIDRVGHAVSVLGTPTGNE